MTQASTAIENRFVPTDLDPGDWAQLEPLYQDLLDRALESAEALRQWLVDYSELSAVISEHGARLNINHACHTDDEAVEKAYLSFVETIPPKIKPCEFQLKQKFLECPHRSELEENKFELLAREWQAEVDLYREANIPLQTDQTRKISAYDKIAGAMTVDFRGETYTLQQLGRFLEDTDRSTREEAWTLSQQRRLQDRESIDDIFDELMSLRKQIAANADCATYRDYVWQDKCRFDYSPDDCHAFAEAVAKHVVPVVEQLDRERRETLGVDTLRPWDLAVDAKGRSPLAPFDRDDVESLVSRTRAVYDRIDPTLGEQFARLQFGRNLDLASRKGKRGGGFQAAMLKRGEPFIFMNAAGLQRDVETLLHEGGHAFHFLWASENEPLVFLRGAPMEFNEVASMSMELIAADALDPFYPDETEHNRAKRSLIEHTVRVLPWVATIDQFQHWLYTHPDHTRQERTEAWLSIHSQFASSEVDWSGYEQAQANLWQKQLHLFHAPFYYIEYGIAQLGALQMWQRYQADPEAALRDYRQALSLGGTRPLPALFEAAGLTFDFSETTIQPAMEAVQNELARLPA
jgi:oligoendopeptidase F